MKKFVMMIDLGVSNSTKTLITTCNLQDTKKNHRFANIWTYNLYNWHLWNLIGLKINLTLLAVAAVFAEDYFFIKNTIFFFLFDLCQSLVYSTESVILHKFQGGHHLKLQIWLKIEKFSRSQLLLLLQVFILYCWRKLFRDLLLKSSSQKLTHFNFLILGRKDLLMLPTCDHHHCICYKICHRIHYKVCFLFVWVWCFLINNL